ncbi:MAG: nickel-responsive transcriptional regulator NikR [Acidobacteria bacterium]|nr:nickel-responsive transcriptional regulator NikR [Acidobacteriota bacterium]
MRDPTKGHAALRRGRVSIPHADYFLTVCTDEKRPGLTSPAVATAILTELRAMDADGTWQLRCAAVMPDHVHVLAILGERLTLGQSVGRLKSKTQASLRAVAANSAAALVWERDFYDHHVRLLNEKLTDMQHKHFHSILSTLHVHLDHDNCLEVLILRGKASTIQHVADLLIATKGVKHGRLTMTAPGSEL